MSCSIINKNIQLLIQQTETAFSLLNEGRTATPLLNNPYRSATQNPDVSRAHMSAILRQARRDQASPKSQQTYWSVFLSHYVTQNANSNAAV
jgi:hypothetical protein